MSMFEVPDTITSKNQRSKEALVDDYRGISGRKPTTVDESGTPFIYGNLQIYLIHGRSLTFKQINLLRTGKT